MNSRGVPEGTINQTHNRTGLIKHTHTHTQIKEHGLMKTYDIYKENHQIKIYSFNSHTVLQRITLHMFFAFNEDFPKQIIFFVYQ